MTPEDITATLTQMFSASLQANEPESWQVEANNMRLLVLLSEDRSWLRALVTIAPVQDAEPFLEQLLEANFDETQEARYAVFQGLLWGVFQHSRATLTTADFQAALSRLVAMQRAGLDQSFSRLAEAQVLQIIRAAKLQGQSLEATLQTLDRLYEEGVMGDIDSGAEARDQVLSAWKYQLERLWNQEGAPE